MERIFEIKSPVKTTIKLDNSGLEIQRSGFLTTYSTRGIKKLFYQNISAIHMKNATTFSNGYLQFSFHGGQEKTGTSFIIAGDENAILFSKKNNVMMQELKMLIEKKIVEASAPASPPTTVVSEKSVAEQIKEFKELFDLGVISEDEFNQKKKQLLNL